MERVKILVIGAGAVGLAIGYELAKKHPEVVVVDKEKSFGQHTSSRNSEVIHAGLYYPKDTLKARLCVEGNELLYGYLADNGIPHRNTGKIILATNAEEEKVLHKYLEQGTANGCEGLKLITSEEVRDLEPLAKCVCGLWVPTTGIFDTHRYMESLARHIENNDGFLIYQSEVTAINPSANGYLVEFANGEQYETEYLVNSAGLWADQIAALCGMDVQTLHIRQYPCKAEYYKSSRIKGVEHLIYPVADPSGVFLGIHLTINLNGEVRFGPNAFYVDDINYKFEDEFFEDFYQSINRYLDVSREELVPDDTGIRPKLQGPGDSVQDFYIREESDNGLPGLVNLIGIESPGLTASLAIARQVSSLIC